MSVPAPARESMTNVCRCAIVSPSGADRIYPGRVPHRICVLAGQYVDRGVMGAEIGFSAPWWRAPFGVTIAPGSTCRAQSRAVALPVAHTNRIMRMPIVDNQPAATIRASCAGAATGALHRGTILGRPACEIARGLARDTIGVTG